jgi:hypothetical protein
LNFNRFRGDQPVTQENKKKENEEFYGSKKHRIDNGCANIVILKSMMCLFFTRCFFDFLSTFAIYLGMVVFDQPFPEVHKKQENILQLMNSL